MTPLSIKIGTSDFRKLREQQGFFVDKSLFIRDIIEGSEVTVLPRPRRFGKTLNLSMLAAFFDCHSKDQNALFAGLKILQQGTDILRHKGAYPVISLSLKDWKFDKIKDLRQQLADEMSDLIGEHEYLLPQLSRLEARRFQELYDGAASLGTLQKSLKLLSEWLEKAHGAKVIILIDEYDSPLLHAHECGYFNQAIALLRPWLSVALKDNVSLLKGVLTGILRIAKENLFSGLNNPEISTVINPGAYATSFGFTEPEVLDLLATFGLQTQAEGVKSWYNGYSFGAATIYNPWSVTHFARDPQSQLKPHWLNTSNNALVFESLRDGGEPVRQQLQQLLEGGEIRSELREDTVFAELRNNPIAIWSLLVFTGYLKADDRQTNVVGRDQYRLRVPNRELHTIFADFVQRAFFAPTSQGLAPLLEALLADDARQLDQELNEIFLQVVGIHDVAKEPEAFLHGFFLAIAVHLSEHFQIESNREAGRGRADLVMIPRPNCKFSSLPKIIEFKSIKTRAKPATALAEAFSQIESQDYPARVRSAGFLKLNAIALVQQGKKLSIECRNLTLPS